MSHVAPFAPAPFSVPARKKNRYLLPIAIGGAFLIGATYAVMTIINNQTDEDVAQLPVPQSIPTPPPRQNLQPTPPPRIPKSDPYPSSNRPQPQRPPANNASAINPNPLPRLPIHIAESPNDRPAEVTRSGMQRLTPLKQFPTAPLLVAPVQVDNTVYFASRDGDFYAIDADTLEMKEQRKLQRPLKRLFLDGSQLKAQIAAKPPLTVIDFNKTVEALDTEDVEANGKRTTPQNQSAPPSWYARQPRFNQVVFYKGKYYQPAPKGVKVFDGAQVWSHESSVSGLNHWKIALLPSGPLGYDTVSIYELDGDLCPTRRLLLFSNIDSGMTTANDCSLVGDGKTFCFLQQSDSRKRMMIWSVDGKRKLRDRPVIIARDTDDDQPSLRSADYRPPPGRLRPLAGGYLLSARQLIWLPPGAGDVIEFRPIEPTPTATSDPATRRYAFLNLTPPAIVGSKIFVGQASGNIYVFDASAFASGSTSSTTSKP